MNGSIAAFMGKSCKWVAKEEGLVSNSSLDPLALSKKVPTEALVPPHIRALPSSEVRRAGFNLVVVFKVLTISLLRLNATDLRPHTLVIVLRGGT